MEACLVCCVCTRAKFIQYIKELGVASSLTYRGIVTFFFKVLPPNTPPPPPSRWPVRLGDQQSFQSQLASQSHHLFVIPVIVVGKRPLLPCSAAAAGMRRAAARLAADGRLFWSERLYNYTYMKNCAEYHTNVYMCVHIGWL